MSRRTTGWLPIAGGVAVALLSPVVQTDFTIETAPDGALPTITQSNVSIPNPAGFWLAAAGTVVLVLAGLFLVLKHGKWRRST